MRERVRVSEESKAALSFYGVSRTCSYTAVALQPTIIYHSALRTVASAPSMAEIRGAILRSEQSAQRGISNLDSRLAAGSRLLNCIKDCLLWVEY
jgi:hypothetical protein